MRIVRQEDEEVDLQADRDSPQTAGHRIAIVLWSILRMVRLCLAEDEGEEGEVGDHVGVAVDEVLHEVASGREATTTTTMMAALQIPVMRLHPWLQQQGLDVQCRNRLHLCRHLLLPSRTSGNVRIIIATPKLQSAKYVCVVVVLPAILLYSAMGAMRLTTGGVTSRQSSKM